MKNNIRTKEYSHETSFPFGMHRRIMRRLFFEKYHRFIFGALTLSFVSATVSGWYIWRTLIEKGTMDIILDFYGELNLGYDFISEAGNFILSDISWVILAILLTSATLFFTLFLSYASMAFRTAAHYKLYKY